MKLSRSEQVQRCFEALQRAAVAGARCPLSGSDGVTSDLTAALAKSGRIKIEVYARNYRVVEILDGPNKGKRTRSAPVGHETYKLIDKRGTLRPDGTPFPKPHLAHQSFASGLRTQRTGSAA